MATTSYQDALAVVLALPRDEQLRLLQTLRPSDAQGGSRKRHVMEFAGLGKELWQKTDTDDYLRQERAAWDGIEGR